MKKLATLLLAAGMVLGSFAGAQAIDWKAKGEWIFEFGYTDGLGFARDNRATNRNGNRTKRPGNGNGMDNFEAAQRVRLQIDAVASESLSGQVFFEIGDHIWGRANGQVGQGAGGALGADGVSVELRRAFIDWIVPNTDLRVRMGIQGMALPSYTFESAIFNSDVAGITASYKVTDNVSLLAFWARPYNNNFAGNDSVNSADYWMNSSSQSASFMDNTDAFGLAVPLSFDGFKITPWGMLSFIGPNTLANRTATDPNGLGLNSAGDRRGAVINGLLPAAYGAYRRVYDANGIAQRGSHYRNNDYATAWWVGLTGEITAADPLRIAWDANYGSVGYQDTQYLNRAGWFINLLVEYKFDWGVPGVYGWWGSGDDANVKNGSERMPVFDIVNTNLGMSTFGFNGGYYSALTDPGYLDHTGTWGIGLRVRDMSFLEDLKHTLRVNLFGGTNDPVMAKYITGKKSFGNRDSLRLHTDFNTGQHANMGTYLTTQDYGLEVNLDTTYKIYENLDMMVELGYMHLWLDQSRAVWGAGFNDGDPSRGTVRGVNVTDAIKASVFFRYSF